MQQQQRNLILLLENLIAHGEQAVLQQVIRHAKGVGMRLAKVKALIKLGDKEEEFSRCQK